ncbi:MAG TPA: type II toxin-antitoxin system RelE/ParE family toxin [Dongiaceae bacterium]|nr:type II toxin-antitoxin system RelE/ParE family toxin [Dongiaceae bacterium]
MGDQKSPKRSSTVRPKRPLCWMGSTKKDVTGLPEDVKRVMGFCLNKLQEGVFDERIEPMIGHVGLKRAKVVEIRENFDGDTFRTMAAIKYPEEIYVLHVFKKKSHKGRETPQKDIDTIRARLADVKSLRKNKGYVP